MFLPLNTGYGEKQKLPWFFLFVFVPTLSCLLDAFEYLAKPCSGVSLGPLT
jgi:hypothetical protein